MHNSPRKFAKKYAIVGTLNVILASCGGGPEIIEHLTVHSTPAACIDPVNSSIYFCDNTRDTNDYVVKVINDCAGGGIGVEWGVTYHVTVAKKQTPPFIADACDYERSLISIDGQIEDPVGTRYQNGVGSSAGGLTITRVAEGENWFRLNGYKETIYCENDVCGQIATQNAQSLPAYTEFELALIDGKRRIQLVATAAAE